MTKNRAISGNALIKWCNWLINHVSKTKKTSLSGFENKIKHPLNLNLRTNTLQSNRKLFKLERKTKEIED